MCSIPEVNTDVTPCASHTSVYVSVLQNDLKSYEVSSLVILKSLMKLDTRSRFSMNTTPRSLISVFTLSVLWHFQTSHSAGLDVYYHNPFFIPFFVWPGYAMTWENDLCCNNIVNLYCNIIVQLDVWKRGEQWQRTLQLQHGNFTQRAPLY